MSWFGPSWGAPVCQDEDEVPVPVGEACVYCREKIAPGDRGIMVGVLGGLDQWAPMHVECNLRLVIGSVAHQQRRCCCFGGAGDDDPHLTKRQAAQAALVYYTMMLMGPHG